MAGKCIDSIVIMVNQAVHWALLLRSLIPLYATWLSHCSLHSSLTFSLLPEVAAVWCVLSQTYLWCILEANRSGHKSMRIGQTHRNLDIFDNHSNYLFWVRNKKRDWVHRPFPCNLNQDSFFFFSLKSVQFFLLSLKKYVILSKRGVVGWHWKVFSS